MDVKYPDVTVKLIGKDGNSFSIMGAVTRSLRAAGVGEKDVSAFLSEAKAGDYDNLLQTCLKWVNVK